MKKSCFVAVLLVVTAFALPCAASLVTDHGAAYYTTLEEAMATAQKDGKPTVIKFFTDWCYWCKVMDTGTLEKQAAIDAFSKQYVLTKINAEVDTAIATKYAISGYPTTVMLDKDGNEIDRIVGYMPADDFLKTLSEYQQGIGTLADLLSKSEKEPTRQMSYDIADKYKYRGKLADAKVWYDKVIAAGSPKDSMSGECRGALADMLRRDKKWDDAIAAYASVMTDFAGTPFATNAEIMRAIVYSKKGDTTASIGAFEAFIKNNPKADPDDLDYAKKQIDKLSKKSADASK